ncbi:phosphoribosylglycinamide formyltransferase [Maribellus comscasis]|uniref:Phosphoribosylglycinamide formyltransferase n=1 Tax=Maribellus comscasis TaxID=2681766 RepID=A0A6I6JQW5_9BACT|nr:phosphoribosylglycinamide formyltransferase [Maribellus comscasis]QGY43440.1 phosphoribosylglycinamide formyltransferase [Maribellus comscasis]
MNVKKIALFASGSGTNVQNVIEYFADNEIVDVDSVWCNNPKAYVLERAEKFSIDTFIFDRETFYKSQEMLNILKKRKVDLVVLAGFLWLIPDNLIQNFPIINIHPALLPKYGGKGMYGMNVHKAVVENRDLESGISVHYVNEKYDDGKLIFQAKCKIEPSDTPEIVAKKVHELEYKHFPEVIESVLSGSTEKE